MSKRLIRIFPMELSNRTSELISREINVVLKSNQTFFGRCWKIKNHLLYLKDQRKHDHSFAFTQVESVIYDQLAHF